MGRGAYVGQEGLASTLKQIFAESKLLFVFEHICTPMQTNRHGVTRIDLGEGKAFVQARAFGVDLEAVVPSGKAKRMTIPDLVRHASK